MSLRLDVKLGSRSYPIALVNGSIESFGRFARETIEVRTPNRRLASATIVTDSHVAPIAKLLEESLVGAGVSIASVVVPPGESSKSLNQASLIFEHLISRKADRTAPIIAIGGGVVGDLAGFVAATYARGVPLLMVPTTLLAQVDSSVGGKVGVNHSSVKNIVGAFHQPSGVWIDSAFLKTLDERQIRSGIAEVIKYGVISSVSLFEKLESETGRILQLDDATILEIVAESCRIKAEVVAVDEREETGARAILNFGHTVGHAVESAAGFEGAFTHGEAVAVGMVAEAKIARRLGLFDQSDLDRLTNLIEAFGLPTQAPGLDPRSLLEAMRRDKKNRGGCITMVLPLAIGRVELRDTIPLADLDSVLAEIV